MAWKNNYFEEEKKSKNMEHIKKEVAHYFFSDNKKIELHSNTKNHTQTR